MKLSNHFYSQTKTFVSEKIQIIMLLITSRSRHNVIDITSNWDTRSKVSTISFRSVGIKIKSDILTKLHVGGIHDPWLSIFVILCTYVHNINIMLISNLDSTNVV